jgi:hypothetical protein
MVRSLHLSRSMIGLFVLGVAAISGTANAASIAATPSVTGSFGAILASERKSVDSGAAGFTPTLKATATAPENGGTAWVLADLQTGTLRGFASTSGVSNTSGFSAGMYDRYTFNIAGANADTVTRLFLNIEFEAATQAGNRLEYTAELRTNVSTSASRVLFGFNTFNHTTFNTVETFNRDLSYASRAGSSASGNMSYLLPFDVRGTNSDVQFINEVAAHGDGNGITDFANSGHLRFFRKTSLSPLRPVFP